MRKHLKATVAKVRQVRAKVHEISEKRAEFRFGHHSILRDLAELARRSMRRRRYGDG